MIRRLSREQITEIGTIVLEGKLEDLERIANDPNSSVLKVMIVACVQKAVSKGDTTALATILEQIAGRMKQTIEHGGIGGMPIPISATQMSTEEIQKRVQELAQKALESGAALIG